MSNEFLTGTPWNTSTSVADTLEEFVSYDGMADPAKVQSDLKIEGLYERLDKVDCIRAYGTNFVTQRRNLLLVAQNETAHHVNLFEANTYFYTNDLPFEW